MKISIQENLLPGETLNEKLDCAETLQIDGIEIQGRSRLYERISEYEAAFRNRTVRISSVCGQSTFDWLDPDPAKRQASIDESRRNLEACGHFGAVGQIVPPIFGPPRLPDLSPLKDAVTLEKELLVEITQDLAAFAHSHDTLLLLEPLNRYEQHLLRRQEDGVEIIQKAGNPPGVALLTDSSTCTSRRSTHRRRFERSAPTSVISMWLTIRVFSRASATSTGGPVFRLWPTSASPAI